MTNMSKKYSKLESGFSLFEVLISVLILGVGLLGLGGLQVASMKGAGNAHSRNIANMLTMELSDRMRANSLGVAGGFYDEDVNCNTPETACRIDTICTPQEAARFDVQEVMCGMRRGGNPREGGVVNSVPNGTLQVVCPDDVCETPNTMHNIVITWGERNTHQLQNGNSQLMTLTTPVIP